MSAKPTNLFLSPSHLESELCKLFSCDNNAPAQSTASAGIDPFFITTMCAWASEKGLLYPEYYEFIFMQNLHKNFNSPFFIDFLCSYKSFTMTNFSAQNCFNICWSQNTHLSSQPNRHLFGALLSNAASEAMANKLEMFKKALQQLHDNNLYLPIPLNAHQINIQCNLELHQELEELKKEDSNPNPDSPPTISLGLYKSHQLLQLLAHKSFTSLVQKNTSLQDYHLLHSNIDCPQSPINQSVQKL